MNDFTLLKSEEGCVLHPYDDNLGKPLALSKRLLRLQGGTWVRPNDTPPRGYPTIGWGHRIRESDRIMGPISQERADALFAADAAWAVRAVNIYCPDANTNERAALLSFVYNCGGGSLGKYGIADVWPDRVATCEKMLAIVRSGGEVSVVLKVRRAREVALFRKPVESNIDVKEILASVDIMSQKILAEELAKR